MHGGACRKMKNPPALRDCQGRASDGVMKGILDTNEGVLTPPLPYLNEEIEDGGST